MALPKLKINSSIQQPNNFSLHQQTQSMGGQNNSALGLPSIMLASPKFYSSENSISQDLSQSILQQLKSFSFQDQTAKHRKKKTIMDNSNLVDQQCELICEKFQTINQIETRRNNLSVENDTQIMDLINQKQKQREQQADKHILLQDEMKCLLDLENQTVFLKINIINKIWPMKIKVSAQDGQYQFFMSFTDPFPDFEKTIIEFPIRKEHLYKFWRPKLSSNWCFFSIKAKGICNVEMKCWFTNPELEKWRYSTIQSNKISPIKQFQQKKNQPIKEEDEIQLQNNQQNRDKQSDNSRDENQMTLHGEKKSDEIEDDELNEELQNQKLMVNKTNFLRLNMQLATHYRMFLRKKSLDHIQHSVKVDEVYNRHVNQYMDNYKSKFRHKQKIARINKIAKPWLLFMKLICIADSLQERIIQKKLIQIFFSFRQRVIISVQNRFRKMISESGVPLKERQLISINLCMNVYGNLVKKRARQSAGNILQSFLNKALEVNLIQTIERRSYLILSKVAIIKNFRKGKFRDEINLVLKMIELICDEIRQEDYNQEIKKKALGSYQPNDHPLSFYALSFKTSLREQVAKKYIIIQKNEFHLVFQEYRQKLKRVQNQLKQAEQQQQTQQNANQQTQQQAQQKQALPSSQRDIKVAKKAVNKQNPQKQEEKKTNNENPSQPSQPPQQQPQQQGQSQEVQVDQILVKSLVKCPKLNLKQNKEQLKQFVIDALQKIKNERENRSDGGIMITAIK